MAEKRKSQTQNIVGMGVRRKIKNRETKSGRGRKRTLGEDHRAHWEGLCRIKGAIGGAAITLVQGF